MPDTERAVGVARAPIPAVAPRDFATGTPSNERRSAVGALGRALVGAAVAGLLAAVLETRWVCAATVPAPPAVTSWLALWGLVAPIAALGGTVTAIGTRLVHGGDPPTFRCLLAWLGAGASAPRAARGAILLLAPSAGGLFLVLVGRLALRAYVGPESSVAAGAAIAVSAALVAVSLAGLTLAAGWALAPALARAALPPAVAGLIGLVAVAAWLGFGVTTGDLGGAGGPLALFGVFRRAELDLRPPLLLSLIAAAAYLAPGWLHRLPARYGLLLGLLPLLSTAYVAGAGLADRTAALAIERSAPLGRASLGAWRRVTDRDRDGASPWFGGGDCDDRDAARRPGADDLPENGLDEDCSGRDAPAVALDARPATPPPTVAEWLARRLPPDLNVMVLSIDALRWDAVGFMGCPRPTTPNLDRLAAEGVVFERAYALASYTGKSLPPTMIGKYTSETYRGWAHFNRIDERDTLVWERLQRGGVRTLSVQAYWYFFRKGIGFERGWDLLDGSVAPTQGYTEEDRSSTSDRIAERTLAVLDEAARDGRRFFFWTHYVDTHADYVRHEGFDFGASERARYDGEVAFTDHHLGRVIDHVRRGPLGPKTAIIVTADHGEAFGEHGMIRHGFEIWEPLVRVPLLVYVPGVAPRRVAAARSLVDLAPTLLELFRVALPTAPRDDLLSGRSLVPDVFAPPGYKEEPRAVFVDMAAGPNNADRQALIADGLKLITSNGRPLGLYDIAHDPEEAKDLLDDVALREGAVARFQAFRRQLRVIEVKPPANPGPG